MSGELLVRASVWLALLGYVAGALHACARPRPSVWDTTARLLWTMGCVALLVHVIAAFHTHYQWSHRVALYETARQTAELTGRQTGMGLYVNYVFALVWVLDAAWWWRGLDAYRKRPVEIVVALHAFMFFIVFNGTVVFASGPARWIGVVITVLLGAALVRRVPWGDVAS